jgi:hypothetical protein
MSESEVVFDSELLSSKEFKAVLGESFLVYTGPIDMGDGWEVRAKIRDGDGQPVVEALVIRPSESLPPGGLTMRRMRSIRLGDLVKEARDRVFHFAVPENEETADYMGFLKREPRPGRRGRQDAFYASVALDYVSAGTTPVKDMAKRRHLSQARVRDLVHEARRRELLSRSAGRGRAGGSLTEKAKSILAEARQTKNGPARLASD